MSRLFVGKSYLVVVALVLALGLGGVALAQRSTSSVQVSVTILDSKLQVSPTTFPSGTVKLVVVNKGKLSHALAIMGTSLGAKRTPTLMTGKTATLTVTVKPGMYHVWDPVRSSMTHATMLMAKASTTGSHTVGVTGGQTSTGSGVGGGTNGSGSANGGMPMDPNDPCAGM